MDMLRLHSRHLMALSSDEAAASWGPKGPIRISEDKPLDHLQQLVFRRLQSDMEFIRERLPGWEGRIRYYLLPSALRSSIALIPCSTNE